MKFIEHGSGLTESCEGTGRSEKITWKEGGRRRKEVTLITGNKSVECIKAHRTAAATDQETVS